MGNNKKGTYKPYMITSLLTKKISGINFYTYLGVIPVQIKKYSLITKIITSY